MNPKYSRRTIAGAFKADPVVAMSEFGADGVVTFRQGKAALLDAEALSAVVVIDRRELPPAQETTRYYAFVDAAQGSRSGDSMALGVAHKEGGRAVLDLVLEVEPPFSPGQVIVERLAPIIKAYRCTEVMGDRHAVGFVTEYFEAAGIKFVASVHSKSELYAELLPLVNTGVVELLDQPTLKNQLLALQRRSIRGGRDAIDHPRGGHDDVANVAAGALVSVTGVGQKKKLQPYFSTGPGGTKSGEPTAKQAMTLAALGERAKRIHQQADLQHAVDELRARMYDNAPMTSPAVWYIHGRRGGGS
jgi:hypothetical protein